MSELRENSAPAEGSAPGEDVTMPLRGRRPVTYYFSRAARRTRFCDHANLLFLCVPLGLVAGILGGPAEAVFALNILALIRLAPLVTFSIDELSTSVGYVFGKLLQPTSGNAVETIVGIIALCRREPVVARTSLLGSIIAYALLILGSSFFIAGYNKQNLIFDKTLTNTMSSLMMAVTFCLMVPTVWSVTMSTDTPKSKVDRDTEILSHAIAVILLIVFVAYVQFRTWFLQSRGDTGPTYESQIQEDSRQGHGRLATTFILICATLCTIACTFYLVGSIDGVSHGLKINKTFISLVLLPPAGYSAKGITITTGARTCEMDVVLRAVNYSILQILLLVTPMLIILGWIIEIPFTLDYNVFEGTVFFLNLIVMTSTIQNGKCNYFDGIMLVGAYILIAVAFFLRPDNWEIVLPARVLEALNLL